MRLLRFFVAYAPVAARECAPAHSDAFVCLPHGDRFSHHYLLTLLPTRAALSTIATRSFRFAGACPLDLAGNWR
jgi:hypothetical protein